MPVFALSHEWRKTQDAKKDLRACDANSDLVEIDLSTGIDGDDEKGRPSVGL